MKNWHRFGNMVNEFDGASCANRQAREEQVEQGTNVLDKYLPNDKVMASERFAFHLANPTVSLEEYRQEQRRRIRERIQSKRVIYLDTNAWKCLSDYTRGKTTLNDAMVDFAKTMNSDRVRENCVFPIGAATLFELQSMEDPVSISTLAQLVDTFSMNVGSPIAERNHRSRVGPVQSQGNA